MKAIQTKYLGPTNNRGSRIKAFDSDGNSITIGYDYARSQEGTHKKAAIALKHKMGWKGRLVAGWIKSGYVFVFRD